MKGFGQWITLLPEKTENTTKKGMILNTNNMRFKKGIVVCSGVPELKEECSVIYDVANSHETMIDNTKYLITRLQDIAIIL